MVFMGNMYGSMRERQRTRRPSYKIINQIHEEEKKEEQQPQRNNGLLSSTWGICKSLGGFLYSGLVSFIRIFFPL